jgi:hypothetical protein
MDRQSAHGSLRLEQTPRYLIRDLDGAYGERLIGSIRRECIDHVIVVGERHLRHVLLSYMKYYNEARTHLSLNMDAPAPRAVEPAGHILCRPLLGGLHHQYVRI